MRTGGIVPIFADLSGSVPPVKPPKYLSVRTVPAWPVHASGPLCPDPKAGSCPARTRVGGAAA